MKQKKKQIGLLAQLIEKAANTIKWIQNKKTRLNWSKAVKKFFSSGRRMKRKALAVTGTLLLAATITGLGRHQSNAVDGYEEPPVPRDDILQVIHSSPSGKIEATDSGREIVVVFNHPMVPLAALSGKTKGVFRVEPPIGGKFQWHGSRACSFVPDRDFAPGTKYKVTVPLGTQALNGMKLEEEVVFSFETDPLRIQQISPRHRSDIEYEPEFKVRFNYPVSLAEINKKVSLTFGSETLAFKSSYTKNQNDTNEDEPQGRELGEQKTKITIAPVSPLPRDARIYLTFSEGLLPLEGNMGLEKEYSAHYDTYGPLHVKLKGSARTFEDLYDLDFTFNNPVNPNDLGKAMKLDPPAEFRQTYYDRSRSISASQWRLKPDTHYTAVLPAGFSDAFGNKLSDEKKFTFYAPNRRKSYSSKGGFLFIESKQAQRTPVTATGVKELDVNIGRMTVEDIKKYAEGESSYYNFDFNKEQTQQWKTGLSSNTSALLGFDLSPYLENSHGWLGVEFSGIVEGWDSKPYRSETVQFVQSTDLGLVIKESSTGESDVWVHSLSTGQPVENTVVDSYYGNESVDQCTTDPSGHCQLKNRIGEESYVYYSKMFYVATKGDDSAYVLSRQHALSMWGISSNYDQNAARPFLTGQIVFDRKLYRPGDEVFFKAYLGIRRDGKMVYEGRELGKFKIQISNARGKNVYEKEQTPGEQGSISGSFVIGPDAPLGHYTLSFTSEELGKDENNRSTRVVDTFQVEEFRPVAFSVTSHGFENTKIENDLSFDIEGKYLFGAPMQKASYEYTINRKPENLYIENYSEFIFGDDDYGNIWEPPTWSYYTAGEGNLDAAGKGAVHLKTPVMAPPDIEDNSLSRIYRLELEATVWDVDDKSVTHRKEMTVYPGPVLTGVHVKDRYQSQGKAFEFEALTLDAKTRLPVKGEIEVTIHRKEWNSIQTKGPGGSVQRKNTLVRKKVFIQKYRTTERGVPFSFKAPQTGNYTVTVKAAGSKAYSRLNFYVYGNSYVAWDFRDDDSLTLLPDKIEYKPGDTAKILIQSPFRESLAIVTIEREGIIWQKSYHIKGNGEPLEVPIKKEFIPNVYLGVTLVRPRVDSDPELEKELGEEDMGRPKLKTGVVKLKVQNSAKRLPLEVKADRKSYQPGDKVRIEIKSEPNAEIALSVADRGVLDLVSYQYGDPLQKFYGNWPHGVRIIENRHSLIKQLAYANKGRSPGGKGWAENDEKEGGFDEDSEDGMRKEFRHTAYWNPSIQTDSSGKAVVEFQLPHNLTTFRVQAMAANKGKYNSSVSEFQVQKPVVLQTQLPRFIRPGDQLEVGTVVVNQSGKKGDFKVKLSSALLQSEGPLEKIVTIENGQSLETVFRVSVNDKKYMENKILLKNRYARQDTEEPRESLTGMEHRSFEGEYAMLSGVITVEAAEPARFAGMSPKSLRDGMRFELPVREPPLMEAFAIAGYTEDKSQEMIELPSLEQVSPYYGGLSFNISSTALTGLSNGFDFYRTNPYFCLEQKSSAYLLSLTSGQLLTMFDHEPPSQTDYDFQKIETLFLESLADHQNSDGGFRLWSDTRVKKSYPYLTGYVVFVLQAMREARELGITNAPFPDEVYKKAVRYLKSYLRRPPLDVFYYQLESIAMINYVLARDGESNGVTESMLASRMDKLSLRSKAYLALAIAERKGVGDYRKDAKLKELMRQFKNRMQLTADKVIFDQPLYGSYSRTFSATGATFSSLLQVYMKLEPKSPLIPQMVRASVAENAASLWRDSHSVGQLAYGLWQYHRQYESDNPRFNGRVSIASKKVLEHSFQGASESLFSYSMSMEELSGYGSAGNRYPLDFMKENGEGRFYYNAKMVYAPLKNTEQPRDEGMEVHREVLSLAGGDVKVGAPVNELQRGKTYLYRLTVINPKPVYYFVLDDPLPSNVEAVNTGFQTESSSFNRFLEEKREDEESDYWWMNSNVTYEYRDDRVVVLADYLPVGVHEFFYIGRATVKGVSTYPAAQAFGMYEPERFGRTGAGTQVIR